MKAASVFNTKSNTLNLILHQLEKSNRPKTNARQLFSLSKKFILILELEAFLLEYARTGTPLRRVDGCSTNLILSYS